ncbi:hypothetical protein BST61_g4438 [Cercospora zeina]
MVDSSSEPPIKHDEVMRDSETDSDDEHLTSPVMPGKKKATHENVANDDDAIVSFQTQDTEPLHVPLAATTRSQRDQVDDQLTPLTGEQKKTESMDNEAGESSNATAEAKGDAAAFDVQQTSSQLEARGLKRKSTARADQYAVPGDPEDSGSNVRRKRAKLPKAARDSNEDDEVASATHTVGKKQAVPSSSGGATESDGSPSSPNKPQAQSSEARASASQDDEEDAEEAEPADDDNETAAVTPSRGAVKKRGRPRKTQAVAEHEETEGEEEQGVGEQQETAAATSTAKPTKKRGRPPKAAHNSEDVVDLDESDTTANVKKKPRKSLRSASGAATPAKKTWRQIATPSATVRKARTPKVLLSASDLPPAAKSWMTKNKIEVVDETPSRRTNFVCVVREKTLPTTLKVMRSLVAGKPVVGDSWIHDSRKEGELQDIEHYVHDDLKGVDADSTTRRSLFAQKTVFFTASARQSYENWQEVAKLVDEAGAVEVLTGNASKGHNAKPKENVIFFGVNDIADDDAEDLVRTHGRVVYDKAAFAHWIINAEIDLDSNDYVLTLPLPGKKGGGKKSKK